jgi:hypothetical protein
LECDFHEWILAQRQSARTVRESDASEKATGGLMHRCRDAACCASSDSPAIREAFRLIALHLEKGFNQMGKPCKTEMLRSCAFAIRLDGVSVIVGLRGLVDEENFVICCSEATLTGEPINPPTFDPTSWERPTLTTNSKP